MFLSLQLCSKKLINIHKTGLMNSELRERMYAERNAEQRRLDRKREDREARERDLREKERLEREVKVREAMAGMSPAESMSALDLPRSNRFLKWVFMKVNGWEPEYLEAMRELVVGGNKIVSYQRSDIALMSDPPRYPASIEYLTPSGELKTQGVTHMDRIPQVKTSNVYF